MYEVYHEKITTGLKAKELAMVVLARRLILELALNFDLREFMVKARRLRDFQQFQPRLNL